MFLAWLLCEGRNGGGKGGGFKNAYLTIFYLFIYQIFASVFLYPLAKDFRKWTVVDEMRGKMGGNETLKRLFD